jgi:hypothetical protein
VALSEGNEGKVACAKADLDAAERDLRDARSAEQAEKKKVDEASRAAAIEAYIASHKLSSKRQADLRQRTIRLGTTSDELLLINGPPDKVNRSVGRWGVHEQWIYGDSYFYIENGTVTSWQE